MKKKIHSENMTDEQIDSDPANFVSPELLNNIGVLRLEVSNLAIGSD